MKRVLITLVVFGALFWGAGAEAPEMKKFLPSEWKYMDRYEGERSEEIADAVREYRRRFRDPGYESAYTVTNKHGGVEGRFVYSEIFGYSTGGEYQEPEIELEEGMEVHPDPEKYKLYEEKLQGHTFYYYVEHESGEYATNTYLVYLNGEEYIVYEPAVYNADAQMPLHCSGASLVYEPAAYNADMYKGKRYETYLIPGKQGKIKAVCTGRNYVNDYKGVSSQVVYRTLERSVLGRDSYFRSFLRHAVFEAPTFLYDKEDPLKYALFNAFDGDLSTSYVEDSGDFAISYDGLSTKGNLLWIKFSDYWTWYFPGGFSAFKIVNGYAKDEVWYGRNNRPKKVQNGYRNKEMESSIKYGAKAMSLWEWDVDYLCEVGEGECILDDNSLEWQRFDFHLDHYLLVTDIYKGSMYDDTCIAELDFKYDGKSFEIGNPIDVGDPNVNIEAQGWLFSSEGDDE